jgi:hypothetical protein
MHDYILLFFRALVVTITIETAVLFVFLFLRRRRSRNLVIRVLVAGIVASSVTLPFVWFVFPAIIENRTLFLAVAELFAFVAEAPIIRGMVKTTWLEAAMASFCANGVSFISGLLLRIT